MYGDYNFTGKLPVTWLDDATKFGYTVNSEDYDPSSIEFPFGFGLSYDE
ncbi:glycosyl hydrolase [Haloplasma contractile]